MEFSAQTFFYPKTPLYRPRCTEVKVNKLSADSEQRCPKLKVNDKKVPNPLNRAATYYLVPYLMLKNEKTNLLTWTSDLLQR